MNIGSKLFVFISSLREKVDQLTQRLPLHRVKQWGDPLITSSASRELLVVRPGIAKGKWELWKMPSQKPLNKKEVPTEPVLLEEQASPPTPSSKVNLIVGVPTSDLMVYPLWIASETNLEELAILELSSKHLLRRGMAEGLKILPICHHEGRTLLVAFASTTIPVGSHAPYLENATTFEAAARLLKAPGAEAVLWHELGEICFGFLRDHQLVWFSGSGETEVTRSLLGLMKRMSLQFQAEAILEKIPQTVQLLSPFSPEERRLLGESFQEVLEPAFKETADDEVPGALSQQQLNAQEVFDEVSTEATLQVSSFPPPTLPIPLLDLPSPQARQNRLLEEKKKQIKKIAALALLAYFSFVFLGGINLLMKEYTWHHLTHQLTIEQPAIEKATQTILTWQEFRGAFDPRMYVLDLLATIASKIKGEKIRLISLAGANGKLHIAGEASDVSQAYHFMESIKAAPELQEYQWVSDQPKLAGKNNVRFELEGSLPNAKTSPE